MTIQTTTQDEKKIDRVSVRERGSLSPLEEYALENWEYFDRRCDNCLGWVPEFEPVIHRPWTPEHGQQPEQVYCSNFCYHEANETMYYHAKRIPKTHISKVDRR